MVKTESLEEERIKVPLYRFNNFFFFSFLTSTRIDASFPFYFQWIYSSYNQVYYFWSWIISSLLIILEKSRTRKMKDFIFLSFILFSGYSSFRPTFPTHIIFFLVEELPQFVYMCMYLCFYLRKPLFLFHVWRISLLGIEF